MGLCPTMAPSTPFVQRPSFACRINQLPARENWPYYAVIGLVNEALPDRKPRARGNLAGQLWAFSVAMEHGDLVVLPRKLTSQVAIDRVTGPYEYRETNGEHRHVRPVEWLMTDIPRATFEQDLLYSFGAFMTVCQISRNDAARRVAAVLEGKPDPGPSASTGQQTETTPGSEDQAEAVPDLVQMAHDQIVARDRVTILRPCPDAAGGGRTSGRRVGHEGFSAWA